MVQSLTLQRILWSITLLCQSGRKVKSEIQLGKQLLCNLLAFVRQSWKEVSPKAELEIMS